MRIRRGVNLSSSRRATSRSQACRHADQSEMATILVADDDVVGRELLRTQLQLGGHRMLEAADGAQALAIVRAQPPDLVITDVLMPRMDGYEFVQKLRDLPGAATIPV